jgi:hypothetical protein
MSVQESEHIACEIQSTVADKRYNKQQVNTISVLHVCLSERGCAGVYARLCWNGVSQ